MLVATKYMEGKFASSNNPQWNARLLGAVGERNDTSRPQVFSTTSTPNSSPGWIGANAHIRKYIQDEPDSPQAVDRKVTALLNKLTTENFDSISLQITAWANKSEKESDGRTLIQVIKLILEKAKDEAMWSELYARLARRMMERISPKVQHEGIKNNEDKPIVGGQLLRKHLLNWCQDGFEVGWKTQQVVAIYSDEYYAAKKAKRQGLGLIKFIGELFKQQMLTEKITHESIKMLLENVDNRGEDGIEGLCVLLATVGHILDPQKSRAHVDEYISRAKELMKTPHLNMKIWFMLQDAIELLERNCTSRRAQSIAAPIMPSQIQETDVAPTENQAYHRQMNILFHGSYYSPLGIDWAASSGGAASSWSCRLSPKAGDTYGNYTEFHPMTFGTRSGFAATNGLPQSRKRPILQPRDQRFKTPAAENDSEDEDELTAPNMMKKVGSNKLDEATKEFFSFKTMDVRYLTGLPVKLHSKFVENITCAVLEKKESDARLLAQFFTHVVSKGACSPKTFEQGFSRVAEIVFDVTINAPKALDYFIVAVKSASLPVNACLRIASKAEDPYRLFLLLHHEDPLDTYYYPS